MARVFRDELVTRTSPELPERYFDRFVFNLHRTDAVTPSILFGFGAYPPRDVVDGFAILVTRSEQRNVRFSTELTATEGDGAGPFRFQVVEPHATWHLMLGPNPTGMEFDLTWRARTPAWCGDVAVHNDNGVPSSFEHLVQSGLYEGTLTIDGVTEDVTGWYGQRDRSRGVRTMSGGQGLHVWYQAQFPDRCVGFLYVEDRAHAPILLEGAVMHTNGELDGIVGVRHDLTFDDSLDLRSGTVEVTTASGQVYRIDADASARGSYMSGGWYGGQHGRPMGRDHEEHDVYPFDGSISPRTLDSALTDRLAKFTWDGIDGYGIFEFAHSRSSRYTYRPSL
ncbi:MAG TPA: hypothetical protein VFJ94_15235 [Intrasporangium sp.]|uniref:DUF7064 domain-containing protein n=1 Tax=Intrasporangium sp. TaxID=1925024 RepID=UPI002D781519|nr:hypothetical protein [Intrasporangium sp.]HET7399869.1 hypothetical protein [Intrasporangium sp.]